MGAGRKVNGGGNGGIRRRGRRGEVGERREREVGSCRGLRKGGEIYIFGEKGEWGGNEDKEREWDE